MPSPFPGMDPYLETPDFWTDFHNNLAPAIQEQLNQQIRPRYVARITTYMVYDAIEIGKPQGRYPDVRVTQYQPPRGELVGALLEATPASTIVDNLNTPYDEPLELARVEIRSLAEQRLVTVIELLSPANKRPNSSGRADYLRKRREILHTEVHLVEIDLHRAGERLPLTPEPPRAPYYVVLSRGQRRPQAEVWAIQLADSLPIIPIPLLEPDADVTLDLGLAVRVVYERAAYEDEIDYRLSPTPPLTEDEAAWVEELLQPIRAGGG